MKQVVWPLFMLGVISLAGCSSSRTDGGSEGARQREVLMQREAEAQRQAEALAEAMAERERQAAMLRERAPAPPSFAYARTLAGPATWLEPSPTAVIILAQRSGDRNLELCRAYRSTLPTPSDVHGESLVDVNIIPVRWLVNTDTPRAELIDDCVYLTGLYYDYERADTLAKAMGLEGKAGPFFVTFLPSGGPEDLPYVVADASDLPDDQLQSYFASWHGAIDTVAKQAEADAEKLTASAPVGPLEDAVCAAAAAYLKKGMPVLMRIAGTAIGAAFPEVAVTYGSLTANEEGRKLFKVVEDGISTYASNGASIVCRSVWQWARTVWR